VFIDETTIDIQAGDGGNGCFAYHREKFIPKGKPNGGNGGRGGNIIFVASDRVQTLQDVSIRRFIKGDRGTHGLGKDMYGRKGKDITILIPLGTIVKDNETGEILHDFIDLGDEHIIATGGRGGRGNAAMRTKFNPYPEVAEEGKPGEFFQIKMTLKVMADVGLVGNPNAGKSTLLSTISQAHPKIADYPFTTLAPNLGIVKLDNSLDSFVMADIPGIIEGAHEGKGLGLRFLRHIERTRILSIMVDAGTENPEEAAEKLLTELRLYSPHLAEKPKIFVLTKTDIVPEGELKVPKGWFSISSVAHKGLNELTVELKKMIDFEKSKGKKTVITVG
jgi:GTP-binding protein